MSPGEIVTGLAYLVGAAVFVWAARRRRLATEGMAILAGVGFVAGIVGAKLTQIVASGLPVSAAAKPGGRALLGGLAFGWLGVEIAKRVMGIRRSTGDLFALALPAGEAVGRIGCHLNGCCYGEKSDASWAVWQHGALRYPAQLLSSATAALTFAFLLWLSKASDSEPLSPRGERGSETSRRRPLPRLPPHLRHHPLRARIRPLARVHRGGALSNAMVLPRPRRHCPLRTAQKEKR